MDAGKIMNSNNLERLSVFFSEKQEDLLFGGFNQRQKNVYRLSKIDTIFMECDLEQMNKIQKNKDFFENLQIISRLSQALEIPIIATKL